MQDEVEFSDKVLENIGPRATRFLGAIAGSTAIQEILAAQGLTDDEFNVGLQLHTDCLRLRRSSTATPDTPETLKSKQAQIAADQWDEPHFRRIKAILARGFLPVQQFMFQDLEAQSGLLAIGSVSTFCHRYRALQGKTPVADNVPTELAHAAIARLTKRGYSPEEITRLEELVQTALGSNAPLAAPTNTETTTNERRAKLVELKLWYDEWAETARTAIKRRDQLIRLGLASRRESKEQE